ncbi:MAG TPA: hypothetical protein VJQ55_06220 [Candidatus Binatia bacterium]|nr:hypothetical protein [Candidatus Binatia bacterium]
MKVLIEIPIDIYYICIGRFAPSSWEYKILKNGIVKHDDRGEEVVEILCEDSDSQSFRQAIVVACPEAANRIRVRPDTSN